MTNHIRSFVCVELSEELKDAIEIEAIPLKRRGKQGKWVNKANYHITLKFLGDVPVYTLEDIIPKLREIVRSYSPFQIRLKGMGAFPNINNIKVIWVGIDEGDKILVDLATKIDNSLAKFGFRPNKQYIPHLTIGRLKDGRTQKSLINTLNNMKQIEFGSIESNSITLMSSTLTKTGPKYKRIERIGFKTID